MYEVENIFLAFIIIIVVVIPIIMVTWIGVESYKNPETTIITVKEKYLKDGTYMIVDTNNNTYQITDLTLKGKFNSSELYTKLEEGETYEIETTGSRIEWLSCYKNINIIKEVQ